MILYKCLPLVCIFNENFNEGNGNKIETGHLLNARILIFPLVPPTEYSSIYSEVCFC